MFNRILDELKSRCLEGCHPSEDDPMGQIYHHEVHEIQEVIASLTAERDAAIADIEYFVKICDTCKHGHLRRLPPWDADGNWQWGDCPGKDCSRNDHPNWQWRGIQEAQC